MNYNNSVVEIVYAILRLVINVITGPDPDLKPDRCIYYKLNAEGIEHERRRGGPGACAPRKIVLTNTLSCILLRINFSLNKAFEICKTGPSY